MAFPGYELVRWDGRVDRQRYFLTGLIVFAIKYNLDRLVAIGAFGRPWGPLSYLYPDNFTGLLAVQEADRVFHLTMVAMSLPFVWIASVMTIRRLRDAGLSFWMLPVLFIPVANWLLIGLLCLTPTASPVFAPPPLPRSPSDADAGGFRSAVLSVLITAGIGAALTAAGAKWLATYGWGLFVAAPLALGFIAASLHSLKARRTLGPVRGGGESDGVAGGGRGDRRGDRRIVCVLMAGPLWMAFASIGGSLAHAVQLNPERPAQLRSVSWPLLFPLAVMGAINGRSMSRGCGRIRRWWRSPRRPRESGRTSWPSPNSGRPPSGSLESESPIRSAP
jgi:uncharacterized membrane protein YhaH (DUF805 family)